MSVRTRSSTRLQALQFVESPTRSNPEDQEFTNLPINRTETEDEIWEEVREEQYEVLEQLPLTLHRQLILLRQLDQKAHDYSSKLLPIIHRYVSLRKILASNGPSSNSGDRASFTMFDAASDLRQANSEATGNPLPSSEETSISPTATRETLSTIARVSDQYLQTSREKVNLAQTAHDLVDRHIRLLDQFIKEQEASLSSETTAPLSLTLSDLVVPKWSRSTRVSMSPMLEEEENVPPNVVNAPPVDEAAAMDRSNKKRQAKGRGRQKDKEEQGVAGLKITLPPIQQVNAPAELSIDPNEPTWCYCNRVSYGEMIGCDNPDCKYEWFHLECVGLTEVPEDDEWYCRDCMIHRETKSRRK